MKIKKISKKIQAQINETLHWLEFWEIQARKNEENRAERIAAENKVEECRKRISDLQK